MPEDRAAPHFRCSDRERAAFQAGIKLGALFHQFTGTPLSAGNVDAVERAIAECVRVQPWVAEVSVWIDRSRLPAKTHEYDYTTLSGDMLDVRLVVRYGTARAEAGLSFVEELHYPLMHLRYEP